MTNEENTNIFVEIEKKLINNSTELKKKKRKKVMRSTEEKP